MGAMGTNISPEHTSVHKFTFLFHSRTACIATATNTLVYQTFSVLLSLLVTLENWLVTRRVLLLQVYPIQTHRGMYAHTHTVEERLFAVGESERSVLLLVFKEYKNMWEMGSFI